jgi:hypothetical protein
MSSLLIIISHFQIYKGIKKNKERAEKYLELQQDQLQF